MISGRPSSIFNEGIKDDAGGCCVRKPILLLSATINCENTPFLVRQDPAIREADYKWAIKGWMSIEGYDTFVFCENSGADLSKLEKYATSINRFQHKVIFLSCNKNAGACERGKGYGEMEIIRHALDSMTDLAPEQTLLKVTGRYRARNAQRLLSQLGTTQAEILCSISKKLTWSDSRIFGITVRCAREHLLSRQTALNDFEGKYFEHVLADAVHGAILAGEKWLPLPCDPELYGVTATAGTTFGYSPLSRIKAKVKQYLIRKVY
jgi:hypothetical protein